MKSKRVSKLLACVLSAAMCTTPVWASSTTYEDKTSSEGPIANGKIETDVAPYSPVISVNVPTKTRVEINPLYNKTQVSVNGYGIASKSLLITNKSYDTDKGIGIPLIIGAEAQVTGSKDGVKVFYEKGTRSGFTPSANSKAKEVFMSISEGSLASATTSADADYKTANKKTDVVTTAGSQIMISANAPADATAAKRTYCAFAVVGDTNVNADWVKDDISIALTYNIKAGNSGIKGKASLPAGCNVSNVSTNKAISINNFPENGIDGATVDKIVIHDTKATMEDWVLDAFNEAQVAWEQNTDGSWQIMIPASGDVDWYAETFEGGKAFDMLIHLDDGRVIKVPLTVG